MHAHTVSNRRASLPKFLIAASILLVTGAVAPHGEMRKWRQRGKDNLACSSCHTPIGREVWDSDISLADVKRRAMNHLSETDAASLAEEVGRERALHKVVAGHMRPFQASGPTIEGASAFERDDQFGRTVQKMASKLVSGEVWTVSDAEAAVKELCATPLDQVVPGFVLDPVSRDPVHRLDGPTLGDWIPDEGLSPAGTLAFEAACSDHVGPDGEYDLPAIDQAVTRVEGPPRNALAQFSRLKRLALLKYASFLATGNKPRPAKLSAKLPDDPIWAVGSFARLSQENPPESLGIDRATAIRLGLEPGKPLQLVQMSLSWMWVGWTLDPSLRSTSLDLQGQNGQYLMKMFWDAGPYPWHAAYFAARRPAEERREAGPTEALQPEINAFVNLSVLETRQPKDPNSRAMFVRFCANLLRTDCLLVEHDLQQGRKLASAASARQQLGALWKFVETRIEDVEASRTAKIVDRVRALLAE